MRCKVKSEGFQSESAGCWVGGQGEERLHL